MVGPFRREGMNNFNSSADPGIKLREFLRRNPELFVFLGTDHLLRESVQILCFDFKSRNESRAIGWNVPVACYLNSIFFIRDWIKDRLLR